MYKCLWELFTGLLRGFINYLIQTLGVAYLNLPNSLKRIYMNSEMLKLEDLGYKKYKASDFESHEWLFQKTIWSDCSKFKKYFININVYDWIEFRNRFPQTDRFSYEPEVFFYSEEIEFTVTYRSGLKELSDVSGMEKFFEDVYSKLEGVPDKLNND